MAEMPEELTIDLSPSSMRFITSFGSDKILINGISLGAVQAATLSWLVNQAEEVTLQMELKVKP